MITDKVTNQQTIIVWINHKR